MTALQLRRKGVVYVADDYSDCIVLFEFAGTGLDLLSTVRNGITYHDQTWDAEKRVASA